jgi:dual specificity MAP kinase phosphatase
MIYDSQIVTPREISKITDRIYIGTYHSATMLDFTNSAGITHVLNCTPDPHDGLSKFRVSQLNINDGYEIPFDTIQFALGFIDKAVRDGKVLVHCHAGVSRSVSLVCAHLMRAGFSWDEALEFVRSKRPQAFPHPKIERSIKQFFGNTINAKTTMLGE